jgi:hypothetical protein
VLKWTAEVREKELQCLEEVELLDNHDPAVEFESDSESEAYDFLEKESGLLHIHKFDSCGFYDGLKAGYQSAADRLDTIPTVAERDKGHWIDITFDASMCSVCQTTQEYETKYCPECGAKMDGDNNVK